MKKCRLSASMLVFRRLAMLAAFLTCGNASMAVAGPIGAYSIGPIAARPRRPTPPGPLHWLKTIATAERLRAVAAGWQPVAATPPFAHAGAALLMTDGTVLVHDNGVNWYTLTPDDTGNYQNGTWTRKATLPAGYSPLYFASAVLPDDRVMINGGEYNGRNTEVWTTRSAIYNPTLGTWIAVVPPAGWTRIGDAPSAVLANGTYLLGNCCSSAHALFNAKTQAWIATDSGKADTNNEEGWTLLPNGELLAADVYNAPNSELYDPANGFWVSAGRLPANLTNESEIGPQILLQNGTVFVAGANKNTALYNTFTHAWSAGPNFPIVNGAQLDIADGPATLLTNGNVLLVTSPGVYEQPAIYLEFDGKAFTQVYGPPFAAYESSYYVHLLLLPTGQVLQTDSSSDVEIFTPHVVPNSAIAPVITSVATTLVHGTSHTVRGLRLNGMSQSNAYGDDAQAATNYPLVAITNRATGHVVFARTHGFSSMAVASTAVVSAFFDVPANIELGPSNLVVVTNGIQSKPIGVTIK